MDALVHDTAGDLVEQASAVFSPDRVYRYVLTRQWSGAAPVVFVMLNPSTADALVLDPTVRRCLGFARREGAGGLVVLNLFAFRATDPRVLRTVADPVGEHNDQLLIEHTRGGGLVIAAWGAHGALGGRDQAVAELLADVELHCLGVNAGGSPKHPLYVLGNAPLVRWPTEGSNAA